MDNIMKRLGLSKQWARSVGVVVAGGLMLALSATGALAADVSFTADIDIPLTTQGITLTILSGGEATEFTVSADNIAITVPTGSSLSIRNLDKRPLTNNGSVAIICHSDYSQLDITGPKTVTITPASSGTCTATTTTTGGGGGGGGSAPPPLATTPPATTPPVQPTSPTQPSVTAPSLEQLGSEADEVDGGSAEAVAVAVGLTRDPALEVSRSPLVDRVVPAGTAADVRSEVANFVTYGTPTTFGLGAGERAGVVNSFRAAFGHVPQSQADWGDALKIANGRWPSVTNATREKSVESAFKKVYLRSPNRANSHDDAAVVIMAYGLRIGTRNLDSEKAAIKSFKAIYGRAPTSASDWDTVRAVGYSGATR